MNVQEERWTEEHVWLVYTDLGIAVEDDLSVRERKLLVVGGHVTLVRGARDPALAGHWRVARIRVTYGQIRKDGTVGSLTTPQYPAYVARRAIAALVPAEYGIDLEWVY